MKIKFRKIKKNIEIIKKKKLYEKKYSTKIKIIFFVLILFLVKYEYDNKILNNIYVNKSLSNFKVCVCTYGRNENRYIREFVIHYEKYGVDKIFLYDNNKEKGERFEDVISDYINKGFVEILNWRGKNNPIFSIMNECYSKNKNNYNWFIFYEIDEFINLYNHINVKKFLSKSKFEKCEVIHLNIINHSDNNKLYYENKSLHERFPAIVPLKRSQISVKSILKGNISNLNITWMHNINENLKSCNGFGRPSDLKNGNDFRYNVIDHYYSKSTEEFIDKINRGDVWQDTNKYIMHRIEKYLTQNKITLEKIEMLEKKIGIDLSKYKKALTKNKNSY